MSTWSEFPLKARWIASTILQTLSMLLTASLVNRPCSSTLCYVLKPPIWSHCVPIAANLALENVAQKTINSLPNLVIKCAPHHTETVRRITPKCRLSSRHSPLPPRLTPIGACLFPLAEGHEDHGDLGQDGFLLLTSDLSTRQFQLRPRTANVCGCGFVALRPSE